VASNNFYFTGGDQTASSAYKFSNNVIGTPKLLQDSAVRDIFIAQIQNAGAGILSYDLASDLTNLYDNQLTPE
jgi:hypothetical protein